MSCFALRRIVNINNGHDHCYTMTGEEIFLFGITKLAHGYTYPDMCSHVFGGCPTRWKFAYKYFLGYAVAKFQNVISFEGLRYEVPHFPRYARQMGRKINQPVMRYNIDTNRYHEVHNAITVDVDQFRIASITDGSLYRSEIPGTGPDGHYKGSPRKRGADMMQRCVYSGYKKFHGIATLSIMVPTGINYIYGPYSARVGDRGAVRMSNMCNFLDHIQDGHFGGRKFATYGDSAFTPMRTCLISRHVSVNGVALTAIQVKENQP